MLREENGSRKYARNERGQKEVTTVLRKSSASLFWKENRTESAE
jgi:hypothetical protein